MSKMTTAELIEAYASGDLHRDWLLWVDNDVVSVYAPTDPDRRRMPQGDDEPEDVRIYSNSPSGLLYDLAELAGIPAESV